MVIVLLRRGYPIPNSNGYPITTLVTNSLIYTYFYINMKTQYLFTKWEMNSVDQGIIDLAGRDITGNGILRTE